MSSVLRNRVFVRLGKSCERASPNGVRDRELYQAPEIVDVRASFIFLLDYSAAGPIIQVHLPGVRANLLSKFDLHVMDLH